MATKVTQVFKNSESIGAFTQVSQNNYQLAPSTITIGALQYTTDAVKTLNLLAAPGAGSLDTGLIAADSTYNVFAVAVSNDIALVASLASVPAGFSSYLDLGIQIKTDYKKYNFIREDVDENSIVNNFINSAFENWQRADTGGILGASNGYVADRWRSSGAGPNDAGTGTVERTTDIPTAMSDKVNYSLKITNSYVATPAGSNVYGYIQGIEDNLFTLKGKKAVYSFWAKANHSGKYSIVVGNWSIDSYREIYAFDVTTDWKQYNFIIDIPSESEVNYQTGASPAFFTRIELSPASGMTASEGRYVSTDNAFSGSTLGADTQDNFFASNGNEFFLTGAMLYEFKGDFIDFKTRGKDLTEELHLCYRYFYRRRSRFYTTLGTTYGRNINTYAVFFRERFPVTMRANANLQNNVVICNSQDNSNRFVQHDNDPNYMIIRNDLGNISTSGDTYWSYEANAEF